MTIIVCSLGLLTKIPAIAQTPAPPQQGPVAITGATIHTVSEGVIEGGTVVFENGLITATGIGIDIPANAEIIDATGKHVYPGFIHSQTTLGLMEIARIQESTDLQETGQINPNIRAQVAFHPASEHLAVAAVHGVTTVVPTPRGSLIAGRLAAMMTDGWTWEEMTVREGLGMVIEWPAMRNTESYLKDIRTLQEAFDKARRYKVARQAMKDGAGVHHPYDIKWESLMPVLTGEMPAFISVGEIKQIQAAIAWAEKEGLQTVLVGNRDMGLVAGQLAEKGIPVILTGVIAGPARQWEGYGQAYKTPLQLFEAGVVFCIAGDMGAASAYRIHHHAASAVAFGLPEEEALRSITIGAARILGIDDLVGSIEPGKEATLMVTDGNALELWTRKEMVFIRGRQIEMRDKHLRLYEQYIEKHRQKQMPE